MTINSQYFTILKYLVISLLMLSLNSSSIDISSFSNVDEIKQETISFELKIDFDNKIVSGDVRISFKSVSSGDSIILDTKNLIISRVIDSNTGDALEWRLDEDQSLESLGTPLIIKMKNGFQSGEFHEILLSYQTTQNSLAVQWYSAEMTLGKEYPFMYTQCEAILCRSFLPCQDTPSAKVRVFAGLTVKKPLIPLYAGIKYKVVERDDEVTYYYVQKIPIPTYLIAIAAGALESRRLSDRISVYAEKEIVDKAAWEFSETEKFIQYAEAYLTTYEWGQYNLLVLPPGFPYGGMENPTLTFVTPSLIAGDRSLANVIAHEIAHSWTGNLVTNKNWQNFWLNEGFTVFTERKIIELIYGEEISKLNANVGFDSLVDDISKFGEQDSYTSLYPDIKTNDPDDAFSSVPYEKGFNFLYYLQSLTGKDKFKLILKHYIAKFRLQSIDYLDWKNYFESKVKELFQSTAANNILAQIDWDAWIKTPGLPPVKNDFSNIYTTEAEVRANDIFNQKPKDDFSEVFGNWITNVKLVFLGLIKNNLEKFTEVNYLFMRDTVMLNKSYNSEIKNIWYQIALNSKHSDVIPDVKEFLANIGRMKYIRPVYSSFARLNKEDAYSTFQANKHIYHPVAVRLIENDFKNLLKHQS